MKDYYPYRLLAFCLALLMFFTSLGIAVDKHFCQGELKHVSFWSKAKSCHQIAQQSHCNSKSSTCSMATAMQNSCQKDCCNNELMYVSFDTNGVETSVTELFFKPVLSDFLPSYSTITLLFTEYKSFVSLYQHYKPPLLNRDIPVLIQSFLL